MHFYFNNLFTPVNKKDFFIACILTCLFLIFVVLVVFLIGSLFFSSNIVFWQRLVINLYFVFFAISNSSIEEFFLLVILFWILCFFVRRVSFISFHATSSFVVNVSLVIFLSILCWRPFQYICLFYGYQTVLPLDCFYAHYELSNVVFLFASVTLPVINNLLIINAGIFYFKAVLVVLLPVICFLLIIDAFWVWANIRLINWNLFALLFCLVIFGIFLLLAQDLLVVFLNLIGLNIIVYSLIISEDFNRNVIEASLKYFFLSTISSLFFIGGLTLLFTVWKTTNLGNLSLATNYLVVQPHVEWVKYVYNSNFIAIDFYPLTPVNFMFFQSGVFGSYLFYVMLLLFVSFIFKLALFPLHSWAAEIYSTFSVRMLFIFIVFLKGIFFVKFIHIFIYALNLLTNNLAYLFNYVLLCVAFGSIFVGSITALFEDKIKKIIAFSSTNQLGFIFSGLVCVSELYVFNTAFIVVWNGIFVSILFLFVYLLSMFILLVLFSIGSLFSSRLKFITDVAHINFSLLLGIMLLFFSFAGLPPLAGFFVKFYVLAHLWQVGFAWLSFGILLLSVVSCYYYLRVIKVVGFDISAVWLLRKKMQFLLHLLLESNSVITNVSFFLYLLRGIVCMCFLLLFFLFLFPLVINYVIFILEPVTFTLLLWVV